MLCYNNNGGRQSATVPQLANRTITARDVSNKKGGEGGRRKKRAASKARLHDSHNAAAAQQRSTGSDSSSRDGWRVALLLRKAASVTHATKYRVSRAPIGRGTPRGALGVVNTPAGRRVVAQTTHADSHSRQHPIIEKKNQKKIKKNRAVVLLHHTVLHDRHAKPAGRHTATTAVRPGSANKNNIPQHLPESPRALSSASAPFIPPSASSWRFALFSRRSFERSQQHCSHVHYNQLRPASIELRQYALISDSG